MKTKQKTRRIVASVEAVSQAAATVSGGPTAARPGDAAVYWRRDGPRVLLSVHAQPGASKTGIAGEHGGALKIRVAAPPVDGRANLELIDFLARRLHLRKSDIELASGAASRQKVFRINAVSLDDRLFDALADPSA